MVEPTIPDAAVCAFWLAMCDACGPVVDPDLAAVRAGLVAAYPLLLPEFARELEGHRGSRLCDCDGTDSEPTNWQTGATMDHHCDCAAVNAAAAVLGAYSKTVHARQCIHGTEFDRPAGSSGEESPDVA